MNSRDPWIFTGSPPADVWGEASPAFGIDRDRPGVAVIRRPGAVARWVARIVWHPGEKDVWLEPGELLERTVAYRWRRRSRDSPPCMAAQSSGRDRMRRGLALATYFVSAACSRHVAPATRTLGLPSRRVRCYQKPSMQRNAIALLLLLRGTIACSASEGAGPIPNDATGSDSTGPQGGTSSEPDDALAQIRGADGSLLAGRAGADDRDIEVEHAGHSGQG